MGEGLGMRLLSKHKRAVGRKFAGYPGPDVLFECPSQGPCSRRRFCGLALDGLVVPPRPMVPPDLIRGFLTITFPCRTFPDAQASRGFLRSAQRHCAPNIANIVQNTVQPDPCLVTEFFRCRRCLPLRFYSGGAALGCRPPAWRTLRLRTPKIPRTPIRR